MSREGSRKVLKKKGKASGVSFDQMEHLEKIFDMFDTDKKGKIDPHFVKLALESAGINESMPYIYEMFCELDTPGNKISGIDCDDFIIKIAEKFGDKESKAGLERFFNIFVDDNINNTMSYNGLKPLVFETAQTDDRVKKYYMKIGDSNTTLDFNEFYNLMTK